MFHKTFISRLTTCLHNFVRLTHYPIMSKTIDLRLKPRFTVQDSPLIDTVSSFHQLFVGS